MKNPSANTGINTGILRNETNLLVCYDAYYATDWKALVAPNSPYIWEDQSGADKNYMIDIIMDRIEKDGIPLSWYSMKDLNQWNETEAREPRLRLEIAEKLLPSLNNACFAMAGEIYREVEAAGDPNKILKYFRPLILHWGVDESEVPPPDNSENSDNFSVRPFSNLFSNVVGYKTLAVESNDRFDPYYKINFQLNRATIEGENKEESSSYLSNSDEKGEDKEDIFMAKRKDVTPEMVFSNMPNPIVFTSVNERKSVNTPIPILEVPELEDIDWLVTPGNDFPAIIAKSILNQFTTEKDMNLTGEVDATLTYAPVNYVFDLPLNSLEHMINGAIKNTSASSFPPNLETYLNKNYHDSNFISISGIRGPVNYVLALKILGNLLELSDRDLKIEDEDFFNIKKGTLTSALNKKEIILGTSPPASSIINFYANYVDLIAYANDDTFWLMSSNNPDRIAWISEVVNRAVNEGDLEMKQMIETAKNIIAGLRSDIAAMLAILEAPENSTPLISMDVYDY